MLKIATSFIPTGYRKSDNKNPLDEYTQLSQRRLNIKDMRPGIICVGKSYTPPEVLTAPVKKPTVSEMLSFWPNFNQDLYCHIAKTVN